MLDGDHRLPLFDAFFFAAFFGLRGCLPDFFAGLFFGRFAGFAFLFAAFFAAGARRGAGAANAAMPSAAAPPQSASSASLALVIKNTSLSPTVPDAPVTVTHLPSRPRLDKKSAAAPRGSSAPFRASNDPSRRASPFAILTRPVFSIFSPFVRD